MTSPDIELERRIASRLLDVLIRAGLILALAVLCYQIFSPFLTLMVWALILAVTLYPLHQMLAAQDGRQAGLAATLLTLLGVALIVAPTAVLMSSLGDSVQQLITRRAEQHAADPAAARRASPNGRSSATKVHALWSKAHADLPALVQSMQPKIGDLAKSALAFVAGIGGGLLLFLASFIIAGIIMAFGEAGEPCQPGDLRAHRRRRSAARSSPSCRRRPSAPSRRASSAWPSSRPSSSASACCSPAFRLPACSR